MCLNIYNKNGRISQNTQGIIQDFLNNIFSNERKKIGQNMNQNLDYILEQAQGELQSIIIFDLKRGLPLYYSSSNPKLHYSLFGDNDIGQALEDFENLNQVQKALDSFGKATNSGQLNYSIFKLTQGQLMVYFYKLPDTTVAICFFALSEVSLGRLVSLGRNNIKKITDNIPNQ